MLQNPNFKELALIKSKGCRFPCENYRSFSMGSTDSQLIRTSYTATHTDEQLDRVLEVFEKVGKKMGVI